MSKQTKSFVKSLQKGLSYLFLFAFIFVSGAIINNCASPDPDSESTTEKTTKEQVSNDDGGTNPQPDQKTQPDQKAQPDQKTTPDKAAPVIKPVTEKELRDVVAFLADDSLKGRYPGTPGAIKARDYIIDQLKKCGVRPLVMSGYLQKIPGINGANILGKVEGTDPSLKDRHVLISAHYDHLGERSGAIFNGANDNASAVASILAVICRIAQKPLKRTVFFAAWDSEEPPNFLKTSMGSLHYTKYATVPLNKIDVAIVLDLVGDDMWKGASPHLVLGAELSPQVTKAVKETKVPAGLNLLRGGLHLPENTPLGRQPWSDYHGFREKSVPVLFFSNGQNKRYHTPQDVIQYVKFPKLVLQTEYLYSLTQTLGNATETPVFNANGADYQGDAETLYKLLEEALGSNGIVKQLGLSATSQQKLQSDFSRVKAVKAKNGQGITSTDVRYLRSAAQRILCYCGNGYKESTCNLF